MPTSPTLDTLLKRPISQASTRGDAAHLRSGLLLLDFRSVRKSPASRLRGFAVVRLPNGLRINDVVISESHGKSWASLPSKPMLDRDDRIMRDAEGRKRYSRVVEWSRPELREGFSRRVVELVRAKHPEAFDTPVATL